MMFTTDSDSKALNAVISRSNKHTCISLGVNNKTVLKRHIKPYKGITVLEYSEHGKGKENRQELFTEHTRKANYQT